jgi:hypothetical protein
MNNMIKTKDVKLDERFLEDDYSVNWGYLYVCDGMVVRSDIRGTVKDLKYDLRLHRKLEARIITSYNIAGRQHNMEVDHEG